MTAFPTVGHLASRAGVCPGANESAGRIKSTKTRDGNRNLKGALGIAALTAARTKDTYFAAKYRRICARRGPMKALVAIERAMVVAAHGMLTKRRLLPRSRRGLLHRPPARHGQGARDTSAPSPRIHRHPAAADRLTSAQHLPPRDTMGTSSCGRQPWAPSIRRKDGAMYQRVFETVRFGRVAWSWS
jgi:Transposase IS116/IS110/IS902 family